MITFYILTVVFLVATCIFVFLYLKEKDRVKHLYSDIINSYIRKGYYEDTINMIREHNLDRTDPKNFDTYRVITYVSEIDRYTNGQSKIRLDEIEVVSGFNPKNYEYIKKTTKETFCSIKNTVDIQWLESENVIKEQRKEKLDKIMKK